MKSRVKLYYTDGSTYTHKTSGTIKVDGIGEEFLRISYDVGGDKREKGVVQETNRVVSIAKELLLGIEMVYEMVNGVKNTQVLSFSRKLRTDVISEPENNRKLGMFEIHCTDGLKIDPNWLQDLKKKKGLDKSYFKNLRDQLEYSSRILTERSWGSDSVELTPRYLAGLVTLYKKDLS